MPTMYGVSGAHLTENDEKEALAVLGLRGVSMSKARIDFSLLLFCMLLRVNMLV